MDGQSGRFPGPTTKVRNAASGLVQNSRIRKGRIEVIMAISAEIHRLKQVSGTNVSSSGYQFSSVTRAVKHCVNTSGTVNHTAALCVQPSGGTDYGEGPVSRPGTSDREEDKTPYPTMRAWVWCLELPTSLIATDCPTTVVQAQSRF